MMSWRTTHDLCLMVKHPNILLKLHVDPVNILRDIAIFIFAPFGLNLPIHAHFWVALGHMTGFPLELVPVQGFKKLECGATRWSKKFKDRFSLSLDTVPECD